MKTLRKLLSLLVLMVIANILDAAVWLPHIIADRMVLQQNTTCQLWGWASPGESVKVKASWGMEADTVADAKGNWLVHIKTPKAGGPYYIDFVGTNYIRVSDVLVGEVFFASGQSNMEMPLIGWQPYDTIPNGAQILANCSNDNIRFHMVEQKASFNLESDANGWWYKSEPDMARNFSALAYFFAKRINEELNVPVGIIQVCWSGSNAECWSSIETSKTISTLKGQVSEFERCKPLQQGLEDWISNHPQIVPNSSDWEHRFDNADFLDKGIWKLSYDDADWKTMRLPMYIDNPEGMGTFDGVVWFRKWINIPAEWGGKKLILSLGPIDDMDVVFVNGEKVGQTLQDGQWAYNREYPVEPGLVRGGDMLIAIRLIDNGNGGGFSTPAENFCIYPEGDRQHAVSVAGDWRYLPTAELKKGKYYYYDYKKREYYNRPNVTVTLNMKTISALYNAMINPIIKYSATGVLWAQGESNVGRAGEYMKLFPALMANWRAESGNPDLKFLYTQLSPYPFNGGQSERFREAQRRIQYENPGCAMTSVLELGKKFSFLFDQRQKVADRLAASAMRMLYGKDCELSGPELSTFVILKDKVELTFTHTTGGIVSSDGAELRNFEVVDSRGNGYPAHVKVDGDKVTVWSDECASPKNVRYAYHDWVDNVNFFNGAGFPASSFTTEKKVGDTVYKN